MTMNLAEIQRRIELDTPHWVHSRLRLELEPAPSGEAAPRIAVHFDEGTSWCSFSDLEQAVAAVADAVQVFIRDTLGTPWPEVIDDENRCVGVLDATESNGRATWCRSGLRIPVGRLHDDLARAGLHVWLTA